MTGNTRGRIAFAPHCNGQGHGVAQAASRHIGRVLAAVVLLAPLGACVGTAYPVAQPAAPVDTRQYALPADVLFPFNSAVLRPEAQAALADTLGQIRSVYPYPAIRVVGHTDSIGSDAVNDALSRQRAEAVKAWLAGAGIPPAVVTAEGRGRREPVAPNTQPNGADNPAGRAQNRRVQLIASPA